VSEGGSTIQDATSSNTATLMDARRSNTASSPYKSALPKISNQKKRTSHLSAVHGPKSKNRDVGQNSHRTIGRTSPSMSTRSYTRIAIGMANPSAAPPKNHALRFRRTTPHLVIDTGSRFSSRFIPGHGNVIVCVATKTVPLTKLINTAIRAYESPSGVTSPLKPLYECIEGAASDNRLVHSCC